MFNIIQYYPILIFSSYFTSFLFLFLSSVLNFSMPLIESFQPMLAKVVNRSFRSIQPASSTFQTFDNMSAIFCYSALLFKSKSSDILGNQQHQQHRPGPRVPQSEGGKNMRFSDNRHQGYDSRQGGGRRYHHHHHQQDPNRMNEETFGTTAVREQREQYNKGENSQFASILAWVTTCRERPSLPILMP